MLLLRDPPKNGGVAYPYKIPTTNEDTLHMWSWDRRSSLSRNLHRTLRGNEIRMGVSPMASRGAGV